MTTITIQTDNSHFTKAIVQLCKALGIAKVMTSKNETVSAAAQKKLRPDIAERINAVQSNTATLHTFETMEDLQVALTQKTGVNL
jgi:hypothetical protein